MGMLLCVGCFLGFLKNIAPIGVALAAFITLLMGYAEYKEQGKQKKAEYFFELRKRFKENPIFNRIRNNITEPPITVQEMMDYIGFFEELQIMINSSLLKKETAYYMFGVYAVRCVDSDNNIKFTTYRIDDDSLSVFKVFFDDSEKWLSDRNINPTQIII